MKRSIIGILFPVLFLCNYTISFGQTEEKKYEFNVEKSKITWKAKTEGENIQVYSGKIGVKDGYMIFSDDVLNQGVVFADTRNFSCLACGSAEDSKNITDFVQSSAFLNSLNMDYAVFKMSEAEPTGEKKEANYRIKGHLTIIGYSNEITFPATITFKKDKVYLNGNLTINRSLWKLNNPENSENRNPIGQTVELMIELQAEMR